MILGVPGETLTDESRVALVPDVAAELIESGHEVHIAAGAGRGGDWTDEEYEAAGCTVVTDRSDVFNRADVIMQVRALGATDSQVIEEYREGQIIIGLLGPYEIDDETLASLAERNVSTFALELIPRISRAQSMDALSSMASLGGYKAAIIAAEELSKMFPLEMTAAGTIQPAEVFIIGAGVAGLKAIATAERLGASVRAYDIRLEVKREVESLGADFVELDLETEGTGDDEGYATEMNEEFYEQQRKELTRVVADSDVVITTAAIPGQPAPELVTSAMIENMNTGSVIIDLSAATGGNCEPTVADERIKHEGVTILGPTDLPSTVTHTASEQIANNMRNFLDNMLEDDDLDIDLSDEIIASTLLAHNGKIRAPHRDDEPDDETVENSADGTEATDDA
jgi:NAD(P) transhydrogenase subunit alpha